MSKSIVSKEDLSLVKSILDNENISFGEYDFLEYERFKIGYIDIIYSKEKGVTLSLGEGITSAYMADWYKDTGKILSSALHRQELDRIYELSNTEYKVLLYKLCDDSEFLLENPNFRIVQIGDFKYIILRIVNANGYFSDLQSDLDNENIINDYEYDSFTNENEEEPVNQEDLFDDNEFDMIVDEDTEDENEIDDEENYD